MKYDDASWHYGGDFPKDLPPSAGATHIGMFLSWCLLNGLGGALHTEEFADQLEKLKNRTITPGQHFLSVCDEKFWDQDLSEEGNEFAKAYYDFTEGEYISDYGNALSLKGKSLYHIPDTWATFDKLAPIIKRRYEEQKRG